MSSFSLPGRALVRLPHRLNLRLAVAWLAAGALSVLSVDGGALLLTHLSVPERTREAGHSAVAAVDGLPLTERSALVAYDAARTSAADHALTVREDDFRVLPGGRVRLTTSGRAPTLLMHHLPWLRDRVAVTATETVTGLPYRTTP